MEFLALRDDEPFTLASVGLWLTDTPPQDLARYADILGHLQDRLARRAAGGFPPRLKQMVRYWPRHASFPFGELLVPDSRRLLVTSSRLLHSMQLLWVFAPKNSSRE